ncbi:MAG: hypothetical protein QF535_17080 [Anaerolineales bacterium]|jgi:hypothetical protein|nr:hypothetical protein [Anaerolineales bacterium]
MNHQAIYNTHPNVVSIDDSAGAMDAQGNPVAITMSLYDAEVARLEAEHAATQYQRDRAAEYPSIDELVVALWEGVVEERMASVTALEGLRQAVKAKYPK